MARILCIDDDLDLVTLLKRFLSKNGYSVETALSGYKGLKLFEEENFDLVLCDFRLPDKDGLEMIQALRKIKFDIPIILITAYSDVKIAVKAVKMGAFEYVSKPILPDEILITVANALNQKQELNESPSEKKTAKSPNQASTTFNYLIGESPASLQVQKLIELVAPTEMTVILLGESGTGKEFAARAIHQYSTRNNKPFVAVDCGALSRELAGSELFGHCKGSFTGALSDKKGFFELAKGGTLFLDEIGNLSYENQIKLLRVLQERKIRRIGDEKDIDVDVRLVVATNENLKKKVQDGNFRQDVFYRLQEFSIGLSPLHERKEDILFFAGHFLKKANGELGKEVQGFDEATLQKFTHYAWPGNLRELRNTIRRSVLFAAKGTIKLKDLPEEIAQPNRSEFALEEAEEGEVLDLKSATERAERKAILNALVASNFNKSEAATLLKVDRKTLYNKMNQLGIET